MFEISCLSLISCISWLGQVNCSWYVIKKDKIVKNAAFSGFISILYLSASFQPLSASSESSVRLWNLIVLQLLLNPSVLLKSGCMKHVWNMYETADCSLSSEHSASSPVPLINNTAVSSLGKHPQCTAPPLAAFTAGTETARVGAVAHRENEKVDFNLMGWSEGLNPDVSAPFTQQLCFSPLYGSPQRTGFIVFISFVSLWSQHTCLMIVT